MSPVSEVTLAVSPAQPRSDGSRLPSASSTVPLCYRSMAIDFSSRVNLPRPGLCRVFVHVWLRLCRAGPRAHPAPARLCSSETQGHRKNSPVKSQGNSGSINQLLMTGSAVRWGFCSLSPRSQGSSPSPSCGTCWGWMGLCFGAPVGTGCPSASLSLGTLLLHRGLSVGDILPPDVAPSPAMLQSLEMEQ